MRIGYSSLTGNIYLGKVNKKGNQWIGEKKDITSDFISVMLQKFEPNTSTNISIDGIDKYEVIVKEIDNNTKI